MSGLEGQLSLRPTLPVNRPRRASLSDLASATFEETLITNPMTAVTREARLNEAYRSRDVVGAQDARTRLATEGLEGQLHIADNGIPAPALEMLITRKHEELKRADVYARAPSGIVPTSTRLAVALAGSLLDPLNVASGFVPVVGPARYAQMIGRAGGIVGRTAVRTGIGAVEGAAGAALLEPLIASSKALDQADYDMSDSLLNIAFGGAFGAGLHNIGGAVGDVWKYSRSSAGERLLRVAAETRAQTLKTAIAQAASGERVNVEPIVALDAGKYTTVYHGSPYKFDAFDTSKIGTGEGAQAYGHGLYFAESADVARVYQTQVKDMAMVDSVNKRLSELARIMEKDQTPGGYRQFKSDTGRQAAAEYDELMAKKMAPGSLYSAEISDKDIGMMLDWDKPLSEQSQAIQGIAKSIGVGKGVGPTKVKMKAFISGTEDQSRGIVATGADLYRAVSDYGGSSVEGSDALKAAGIPGIKYFDAASRGAQSGSRNFVVFDQGAIGKASRIGSESLADARAAASAPKLSMVADERASKSGDDFLSDNPEPVDPLAAVNEETADVMAELKEAGYDVPEGAMAEADALVADAEAYTAAARAAVLCGFNHK